MQAKRPTLVVFSSLFPSAQEPVAGVFIRERMFRVAEQLPLTVIAPQPWFPLQSLIRLWKPHYRPARLTRELQDGIEIHRPRFLAIPVLFRWLDGLSMALAAWPVLRRLMRDDRADLLDVHFGYPDGYAGSLLAKWSGLPFLVTLRGKENRLREVPALRTRMQAAVSQASKVIAVSASLRQVGIELGARPEDSVVIGNGIDLQKFRPIARERARAELDLPQDAKVLVSVGGLVERKGFHRVIEVMPALLREHPNLILLVVGGAGPEGDWSQQLKQLARDLGVEQQVRFLGPIAPDRLHVPLSAADLFVLATRYEGWANVFLEAMACGLPVVTTLVGGNAEVVCRGDLGLLVPFGDPGALQQAILTALGQPWDRDAIRHYAEQNSWDSRIETLVRLFNAVPCRSQKSPLPAGDGSRHVG